jgi:hypothetical protein
MYSCFLLLLSWSSIKCQIMVQKLAEENNMIEPWFKATVPQYLYVGETFCVAINDEHG